MQHRAYNGIPHRVGRPNGLGRLVRNFRAIAAGDAPHPPFKADWSATKVPEATATSRSPSPSTWTHTSYQRPHDEISLVPPAKYENAYCRHNAPPAHRRGLLQARSWATADWCVRGASFGAAGRCRPQQPVGLGWELGLGLAYSVRIGAPRALKPPPPPLR